MGIIQRQAFKNGILTYTGILLGAISLLIIQPRFLTKEEIGLTRILFSFSALIATILPLGANMITFRYFPFFRDADNKHNGYFGFMFILPFFSFIAIGIFLKILQQRLQCLSS